MASYSFAPAACGAHAERPHFGRSDTDGTLRGRAHYKKPGAVAKRIFMRELNTDLTDVNRLTRIYIFLSVKIRVNPYNPCPIIHSATASGFLRALAAKCRI